jgi:hypothetical protein
VHWVPYNGCVATAGARHHASRRPRPSGANRSYARPPSPPPTPARANHTQSDSFEDNSPRKTTGQRQFPVGSLGVRRHGPALWSWPPRERQRRAFLQFESRPLPRALHTQQAGISSHETVAVTLSLRRASPGPRLIWLASGQCPGHPTWCAAPTPPSHHTRIGITGGASLAAASGPAKLHHDARQAAGVQLSRVEPWRSEPRLPLTRASQESEADKCKRELGRPPSPPPTPARANHTQSDSFEDNSPRKTTGQRQFPVGSLGVRRHGPALWSWPPRERQRRAFLQFESRPLPRALHTQQAGISSHETVAVTLSLRRASPGPRLIWLASGECPGHPT